MYRHKSSLQHIQEGQEVQSPAESHANNRGEYPGSRQIGIDTALRPSLVLKELWGIPAFSVIFPEILGIPAEIGLLY